MIVQRGQMLLLPVNPLFIWFSLFLAWMIQMMLAMGGWGYAAWAPSLVLIVLMFWIIREPHRIGMSTAFLLGLLSDVQRTSLLGEHALYYSMLCFISLTLGRRLVLFGPLWQALQLFPVFFIGQIAILLVQLVFDGTSPEWSILLAPLFNTILWPFISVLLILPQRRSHAADHERHL
jgi:rod shape-determining protein MreD